MNWLDLSIIFVVIFAAFAGARRGFLRGTLDLLVILASLLAAAIGYRHAAELLSRLVDLPAFVANVIGFVIAAAIAQGVLSLVLLFPLSPLIRGARAVPISRQLDQVLGLVPGAIKGVALATTLLLVVTLAPFGANFDTAVARSRLADDLLAGATNLSYRAQESAGLNLTDFMVVTRPGGEERYRLPYAVTSGLKADPSAEQQMLELINRERRQHGIPPLAWDPELQAVSRAHSEEMWRTGYFSHVSPVTGSPGDRLNAAGVKYRVAGENLALAPSVEIAHRGLMRSEGHRANILSPNFTRVGIGAISAPSGSTMFTQEFAAS